MANKKDNLKIKLQTKKNEEPKLMFPKTVQDTIPFQAIFENGVIHVEKNKYSLCATFNNIDYVLARDEEQLKIFNHYSTILNGLDPETHVQLYLENVNIHGDELYEYVKLNSNKKYADDYNEVLKGKVVECRDNTARKELFLVVSTESFSFETASNQLSTVYKELTTHFNKINSKLKVLDAKEYLKIIYYYFNPGRRYTNEFSVENAFSQGLTVKDLVSPSSFFFRPNYYKSGDSYRRVLFVKQLPTVLKDNFISNLLDCPFKLSISIHIEPTDSKSAIDFITRRITYMESNKLQYLKKNTSYIPYDLKNSIEEAQELLNALVKDNKKLFYVGIYITVVADNSEDLRSRTTTIHNIARKNLVYVDTLTMRQEDGMKSSLPIGNDVVKIKRTLLTDSTAVFMPFSLQDVLDEKGFYYGINQISRSLLILNRSEMENPAGFILGRPRSGKSFFSKKEIISTFLSTDDDILVIDPEDEFSKLCKNFGGEVIKLSADSSNTINPLDMSEDYGAGENPVRLKAEFILSIFECLIGSSLKPIEKTLIDRAVTQVYKHYVNNNYDKQYLPTMKDIYNFLKNQPEDEAKNLALSIEIYVTGSLNMFSDRTNIDMSNRFTVFNTRDLGNQLKTLGMIVVLDFIWNRVCQNWLNKKRTWIYIDEFYMLFGSEYVSSFFNEFFKRSQKRGGIPTGITQNVQEILSSEMARYMLSNSEFITMFNQSPADREELSKLLKLSELQLSYVSDSEEGCGLMLVKEKVIPFTDSFPTDNKLYEMITTKVSDIFKPDLKKAGD